MASRHVSCFVRLHILMHVILRGVFVNEKYYYHSFGHCDAFCRPKCRILAGYNMLKKTNEKRGSIQQLYNMNSQSKLRSN